MENEKSLTLLEVEELKDRVSSATEEEKRVIITMISTEMLKEELERRDDLLDTIISLIQNFSSNVSTQDELLEKQHKIEEFRRSIGGIL
jgi:hypothetical protein